MDIVLGEKYRDNVTGFTGVATAHCTFLHEKPQTMLESSEDHRWLIDDRLERVSRRGGSA
jgi:hypothetical protein